MTTAYPVVAEIWTLFEATLLTQAKRLAEDISKRQGKDPKELWALIKPQIKIGLIDSDLGEPTFCKHPLGNREGAIKLRCRAPCALGFDACPAHIHSIQTATNQGNPISVEQVKLFNGQKYYLDKSTSVIIARDKDGRTKGIVKEDILYVFEKQEKQEKQIRSKP